MPNLTNVDLPGAFFYKADITTYCTTIVGISNTDITDSLRHYITPSSPDCSILSIVSFTPSSQPLSSQHQNQTHHSHSPPSPMSTSPTTSAQSDLDLSSLVNQLSASTDFNDLRQKMTKIENSKVSPLPNLTHSLDKGLRRPPQTPTRETREKGILSPYSSPT